MKPQRKQHQGSFWLGFLHSIDVLGYQAWEFVYIVLSPDKNLLITKNTKICMNDQQNFWTDHLDASRENKLLPKSWK